MSSVTRKISMDMATVDDTEEHAAAPLLEEEGSDSLDFPLTELDPGDGKRLHVHEQASKSGLVPTIPGGDKLTTYLAITAILIVTVFLFAVNTETTAYFEDELGWKKPFCTMYITHGSLCLPWIWHLTYLRIRQWQIPFKIWMREYLDSLSETIRTIDAYAAGKSEYCTRTSTGPLLFLAWTMFITTMVITVSGVSWFTSLSLTTPADLTAIYNCSTFFAAAFSVPILKEKLSLQTMGAIFLSITGTFIIAYGDTTAESSPDALIGTSRLIGNLIACIGAAAFGLYEVLFKKWACSSRPLPPEASIPLTLAATALLGIYTLATLWIGLVVLHVLGVERFVWPNAEVMLWIVISVLTGSVAIVLLMVLVVWTDPVFASVASVFSVFIVALADWIFFDLKPSPAAYVGGAVIIIAFIILIRDTFGSHNG